MLYFLYPCSFKVIIFECCVLCGGLVRYMKVMELHWQCQKVITHVTSLRRFMQSHNYDDEVIYCR